MRLQRQSIKDSEVRGNGILISSVKILNLLKKLNTFYVAWDGKMNVMGVRFMKTVKAQDFGFITLTSISLKLIGKL